MKDRLSTAAGHLPPRFSASLFEAITTEAVTDSMLGHNSSLAQLPSYQQSIRKPYIDQITGNSGGGKS